MKNDNVIFILMNIGIYIKYNCMLCYIQKYISSYLYISSRQYYLFVSKNYLIIKSYFKYYTNKLFVY